MPQNPAPSTLFVTKITSANADIVVTPSSGTGEVTITAVGGIYNPGSVAITGGTINGTTVGATTPAAGTFTTVSAGKDASAGEIDVFPPTTAKGKTTITADDNAGATVTNIKTSAQAGARTYDVPDAGADADFVMSEGNQTVNGVKTFGSPPVMSGASIATATVPNTALAANGGLAALIGAGLGASANYAKTTSGPQTLLASAVGDRSVIIVVVVNETFNDNGGTQPTFQIGQTGTANKFADTAAFANKTAGTVLTFAGTLTGTDNLIVTGVAAVTTGLGGISVTVLALPAA